MSGRGIERLYAGILVVGMMGAGFGLAQAPPSGQSTAPPSAQTTTPTPGSPAVAYQPKFPGDPARSESEAQALGYMRTALRAQKEYKKRYSKYADSLAALGGTLSFTKRMAHTPDRGDYAASFRLHKDKDKEGFVLTMTPKQLDSEHRSFYAEEDLVIHADDQKPADADSPKIK